MFLRFQECLSKKYKQLIEDEIIKTKLEWELGELCVIKLTNRDDFYRGKIVEKKSNGKLKVIFYLYYNKFCSFKCNTDKNLKILCLDSGSYEDNLDKNSLYDLVDEFNGKPDYKAKKCYLFDVHPFGNNNGEWGDLAQQFTFEILNDAYIHVLFMVLIKKNQSQFLYISF